MGQFKNILALDTAMGGCSVTVYKDGAFFSESQTMPRGQAEHLVPMCQMVMEKVGSVYADLDAIVTTIGPGAFTGLRIGMSTAKAFGLALNIPVFGITTLQALALQYVESEDPAEAFTVLIETKRQDFYVQSFDKKGQAMDGPESKMSEDIVPDGILIGDGVERFNGQKSVYILPNPEIMARGLIEVFNIFEEHPDPLYLRAPDVSQPKKKQRVLVGH